MFATHLFFTAWRGSWSFLKIREKLLMQDKPVLNYHIWNDRRLLWFRSFCKFTPVSYRNLSDAPSSKMKHWYRWPQNTYLEMYKDVTRLIQTAFDWNEPHRKSQCVILRFTVYYTQTVVDKAVRANQNDIFHRCGFHSTTAETQTWQASHSSSSIYCWIRRARISFMTLILIFLPSHEVENPIIPFTDFRFASTSWHFPLTTKVIIKIPVHAWTENTNSDFSQGLHRYRHIPLGRQSRTLYKVTYR